MRRPHCPPSTGQAENPAFLQWLAEDHLTVLGYRCHDLVSEQGQDALQLVAGSGLGLLRETAQEKLSASFSALPRTGPGPGARAAADAADHQGQHALDRAPTRLHRLRRHQALQRRGRRDRRAPLHRPVHVHRLQRPRRRDPLLRGKVEAIAARAGLPRADTRPSHCTTSWRTYPRDDLFQISDDDLYDTALGILALGERQRLRLFVWRDPYDRFVSCLVYVPREAYSTDLRMKFQAAS